MVAIAILFATLLTGCGVVCACHGQHMALGHVSVLAWEDAEEFMQACADACQQ